MNQPDQPLDPLNPLKRRDGDPVFDEPWQAQALAMADTLVQTGAFTAAQWADALGTEIYQAEQRGVADDANAYYGAVVAALQGLLDKSGAAKTAEVATRQEQWRQAYLNTPHGKPVVLSAGGK